MATRERKTTRERKRHVSVLERGDVFFVYRPKVGTEQVRGLDDVSRFYMILRPERRRRFRMIVIGKKKLPEPRARGGKLWAFVEGVSSRAEGIEDRLDPETYQTKTRGERHIAAARPAGEGRYSIVRHGSHTHLAYGLELPDKPSEVQRAFRIAPEASYVVSVKNPEKRSPPQAGLGEHQQAKFPKRLQHVFQGRRFADVDPPELLDVEGAELILASASANVSRELGIELQRERETEATAEIFNDLKMEHDIHPKRPLFEGKWA